MWCNRAHGIKSNWIIYTVYLYICNTQFFFACLALAQSVRLDAKMNVPTNVDGRIAREDTQRKQRLK